MNKKYYITTPIYYPSANFHIGHCYTTIIADALARFKKLEGYDVWFQTGTDEHGQKIHKKAIEAGVSPKEYVDKIVENAKNLWKSLGIEYDYFIRTTDENHIETVQKIFRKLYEQGDIYKGEYTGLYCVPCESYWTEAQLIDGLCPDCGRKVEELKEESYFLRLSKYQDKLIEYIESHPDFIKPDSRKHEMINNFIKPGLEDLSVSRTSFDWGIPVDFDEKHVVYVWIDALSNYITSLGYLQDNDSNFKKFWPADLHLIGKEITRFHVIIWPIILMALGLELPKQVFVHGWLVMDGTKIAKSLGNYKDPREYVNAYGVDPLRYFILSEVSFGNDGTFSEEALINRTNADLVNNLGNLVNRTIVMANKYFDSKVKNTHIDDNIDFEIIKMKNDLLHNVVTKINDNDINNAVKEIFAGLRRANKYVDETEPWVLYKNNKLDRLETVIYNLLDTIRVCAILLKAFLPTTSDKIFKQLNLENQTFETIDKEYEYSVEEAEILFQRIDVK